MSSAVSNSIKNGILFVLVVFIVNFAVRSCTELGDTKQRPEAANKKPAAVPAVAAAAAAAPVAATPPQPKDDPELFEYVFGSQGRPTKAAAAAPPLAAPPPPPPSAEQKAGALSDGNHHNGCMVVGQYPDENVMCGGKLFDDVAIEGFDGAPQMFSW
jgi:hypothetical protein